MKDSEAVRVLGFLATAYRTEISDETLALWARSLTAYEVTDALEAVSIAAESKAFMPSLAELVGLVRECRNDRLRALPPVDSGDYIPPEKGPFIPFAEYLRDYPEESVREKVEAILHTPVDPVMGPTPGQLGLAALLVTRDRRSLWR